MKFKGIIYILWCFSLQKTLTKDEQEPFTLDDYLDKSFASSSWNGTWISDTHFYYKNSGGDYILYDALQKRGSTLIESLEEYPKSTVQLSPDSKYALIKHSVTPVFRHSTLAKYTILEIESKKFSDVLDGQKLQLCQWSPRNNSLVLVKDNNIFYISDIKSDLNEGMPLTSDGIKGVIFNGVADWVYEEEVLLGDSAIWMSPFNDILVFARFDDTKVPDFWYFKYGTPGTMENQYPELVTIKYPKINATNPSVDIFVVDLNTRTKRLLTFLTDGKKSEDHLVFDVSWKDANTVAITYTNRIQNEQTLLYCSLSSVLCRSIDTVSESQGWVDASKPYFSAGSAELIQISKLENFNSLVLTTVSGERKKLTSGKKMIARILGIDSENTIYFVGSSPTEYSQQHIYSVRSDGGNEKCLTCDLQTPEGPCKYATGVLSLNATYLTKICNGPGPTTIEIANLRNSDSFIFETNQELRERLSKKQMPTIKDMLIPLKSGYSASVRLLLPPKMQADKKYPMLVDVYAGPTTNRITDAFKIGIEHYLVTSKEYIYAMIDGRGSGKRGYKLMHEIYKRLGTVEIEDQIYATAHVTKKLGFIDPKRVGIWGKSYGGFATAWALAKDTDNVFSCGVSIAPVTDYVYYDSVYTERFMQLPKDNQEGYDNTDLSRVVEKFHNRNFLLIHGNADDNVHYQQSMMLTKALVTADVLFEQKSYPDENHSFGGVSKHLYHSLDAFWSKAFENSKTGRISPDTFVAEVVNDVEDDKGVVDFLIGQINNSDSVTPGNVIFIVLLMVFALFIDY